MVGVAQLVESRIVIPVVVGSSPISHPRILKPCWFTAGLFRIFPYHQTRAVIGFALFRAVSLRVSLSLSRFFLSHNSKAPRKVPKNVSRRIGSFFLALSLL